MAHPPTGQGAPPPHKDSSESGLTRCGPWPCLGQDRDQSTLYPASLGVRLCSNWQWSRLALDTHLWPILCDRCQHGRQAWNARHCHHRALAHLLVELCHPSFTCHLSGVANFRTGHRQGPLALVLKRSRGEWLRVGIHEWSRSTAFKLNSGRKPPLETIYIAAIDPEMG